MAHFNEQNIKELSEAEMHFDNACHHDCIRNAPRWLTLKVIEIYENVYNVKANINLSCSVCVLNIYKTIGKKYYADKELLEKDGRDQKKSSEDNKSQGVKRTDSNKRAKEKNKKGNSKGQAGEVHPK